MRALTLALSLLSADALADERQDRVRANAHNLPDVDSRLIDPAVDAAFAVETDVVRAELLIAIAWEESRLDPSVRTGTVCGPLQVDPGDINRPRSDCRLWARDVVAGWRAAITELEMMLADPRVKGDLHKALRYRACGNKAFYGQCSAAKVRIIENWYRDAKRLLSPTGAPQRKAGS